METLVKEVKRELKITWEDEDTNSEIEALVSDAIPALAHKLGIKNEDIKFEEPGQEHRLFLDYCRYARSGYLNEFDAAYRGEIYQIRHKYEVKYHEGAAETV